MEDAIQRCGFTPETAEYLIQQGFDSPERLLLASDSDIESLARTVNRSAPAPNVSMPFLGTKGLKGFRFWADECRRTGYELDPDAFGEDQVLEYVRHMDDYNVLKAASSEESVSKPSALKKLTGWIAWKESLTNYLQGIIGAAKIPLTYLTREHTDPPEEADPVSYSDHTSYLSEITLLEGDHFQLDNKRFYRDLKSLLIDGDGWDFIKRFERRQDGRAAFTTLELQCEGTASKISRKNKAYAQISNATYKGHNRKYTFQDYIATHQSAHNEIFACSPEEAIPESKKVNDFLKGIEDDKLEASVAVVLGNPALLSDFNACQQFLATTVENRHALTASGGGGRRINAAKSERGASKSDRGGRGGRGGGGGGGKNNKLPKNFKLEDKYYPPATFRLLSNEQKEQLKKWKEDKDTRKVAALTKEVLKELRGRNDDADDDDDQEEVDDGAAGLQFGRRAHTPKGNKKQRSNSNAPT